VSRNIRVAIVAAHDVVDVGLRGILANATGIDLVERHPAFGDVADVVLYDVMAMDGDSGADLLHELKSSPPVIVVARDLRPDLASRALVNGAAGSVSLEADASEIVAAIREVARSGEMSSHTPELGREAHLTLREVEVLSGITHGLSNEEIAGLLTIAPNTLKSYVRTAYRKIGVTTRGQAVGWCLQHGFEPPRSQS
jgi:DNA-binding NarL/FixJ family response regulator